MCLVPMGISPWMLGLCVRKFAETGAANSSGNGRPANAGAGSGGLPGHCGGKDGERDQKNLRPAGVMTFPSTHSAALAVAGGQHALPDCRCPGHEGGVSASLRRSTVGLWHGLADVRSLSETIRRTAPSPADTLPAIQKDLRTLAVQGREELQQTGIRPDRYPLSPEIRCPRPGVAPAAAEVRRHWILTIPVEFGGVEGMRSTVITETHRQRLGLRPRQKIPSSSDTASVEVGGQTDSPTEGEHPHGIRKLLPSPQKTTVPNGIPPVPWAPELPVIPPRRTWFPATPSTDPPF